MVSKAARGLEQGLCAQVDLGHAREKLDAAWHAKDYAKVVELLDPLHADLTPVELKKLEYAEKHVAQS